MNLGQRRSYNLGLLTSALDPGSSQLKRGTIVPFLRARYKDETRMCSQQKAPQVRNSARSAA